MHMRLGRTSLTLLLLLVSLLGACSGSDKPTQESSTESAAPAADPTQTTAAAVAGQGADSQPPIDPQAVAYLEVAFFIKGTGEIAPEVPFEIRWEEDGKPSKTDVRTTPEGTRRIQFEHGTRLIGLVIHPSARTAPRSVKESALLMGGRTHKIEVELSPGGIVSGVVLDIDGRPVANADVGVYFVDALTLDRTVSPQVDSFSRTDQHGRFRVGGLPTGPFVIEASATNMVAVWRPGGLMTNAREFRNLEVLLEPGHVVYGQALDVHEQPVEGVYITAGKPNRRANRRETQYPEVFQYGPRACLARSDADGLFTLNAVPESQGWNLNAKHPRYLPVRTSFGAGQQDVWVELTEGASLFGTIADSEGRAIVGAQLWLLSGAGEPSTFSDKNGTFLFPAGKEKHGVCVLVYKRGYGMIFLEPMDVVAGLPPLNLVLDGGVTIRGKVVDAQGQGLSGVPMRIAGPLPKEGYLASQMPERYLDRDAVLTAPDGSFEFTELYNSTFTVTARPSGKPAVKFEGATGSSTNVVLVIP